MCRLDYMPFTHKYLQRFKHCIWMDLIFILPGYLNCLVSALFVWLMKAPNRTLCIQLRGSSGQNENNLRGWTWMRKICFLFSFKTYIYSTCNSRYKPAVLSPERVSICPLLAATVVIRDRRVLICLWVRGENTYAHALTHCSLTLTSGAV